MIEKSEGVYLKGLTIHREGWYPGSYMRADPTKPLRCTVEVQGPMGKTELNLPPDVADQIVALIATKLAEQSKHVANEMTAQFFNAAALPLPSAAS